MSVAAGSLLRARKEKRQQYIADALERAQMMGRSLTCATQPGDWHRTCTGLDAPMNGGLGCLCECHDVKALT